MVLSSANNLLVGAMLSGMLLMGVVEKQADTKYNIPWGYTRQEVHSIIQRRNSLSSGYLTYFKSIHWTS